MRISNNVTIIGNNIETMSVGIRIAGRNISANGNVIYNHENPTTNRGLLFASNTALTNIGNYGTINGVGNNIADNMTLGFSSNGNVPFTNINSRIELDENSGLKMTKEIDNTTLANDSDVKLYAITHNVYFRNVKLYLINSNDNDKKSIGNTEKIRIRIPPLNILNIDVSKVGKIFSISISEFIPRIDTINRIMTIFI